MRLIIKQDADLSVVGEHSLLVFPEWHCLLSPKALLGDAGTRLDFLVKLPLAHFQASLHRRAVREKSAFIEQVHARLDRAIDG